MFLAGAAIISSLAVAVAGRRTMSRVEGCKS